MDGRGDKNMTIFKMTDLLEKYQTKKCILYIEEIELFFSCYVEYANEKFF
jgi:hypothetical protein